MSAARIGLVSDTHDNVALAKVAAAFFAREGVDAVFHLGDVTTAVTARVFAGATVVRGNNDVAGAMARLPLRWEGEFAGVRVGATHGHVPGSVEYLAQRCDVVLRGHSHRHGAHLLDRALVVNPGALYRAAVRTVALLELPTKRVAFYEAREDGVRPLA